MHIYARPGRLPFQSLLRVILFTAKALHRDPLGSNIIGQNIQRWNCSYVLDEVELFER